MIIRQARKDEGKQLQDLNDEAFADNPDFDDDLFLGWAQSDKGASYFSNLLINPKKYCLVAEDHGKLVGYLAAAPKEFDYRNSKYIEIENLGIIPEYRLQGVGTKLMDQCLAWAKKQGYEKVTLWSYKKNEKAIAFYKKYGFATTAINLEKDI